MNEIIAILGDGIKDDNSTIYDILKCTADFAWFRAEYTPMFEVDNHENVDD